MEQDTLLYISQLTPQLTQSIYPRVEELSMQVFILNHNYICQKVSLQYSPHHSSPIRSIFLTFLLHKNECKFPLFSGSPSSWPQHSIITGDVRTHPTAMIHRENILHFSQVWFGLAHSACLTAPTWAGSERRILNAGVELVGPELRGNN